MDISIRFEVFHKKGVNEKGVDRLMLTHLKKMRKRNMKDVYIYTQSERERGGRERLQVME